ncbi:energy-coupling factor transporter transmembrane component T family protein [Desulfobaculum bizertense]|uniref:Energy-coupling factor transport system permease protein n=1 Tax=Desulfobaculum bizertense DSM 18034 TaxID=1121442 RepID=A0A1T4WCY5_9BACT|nr:energy-coupling factor transporter transmembrane component T [Desulfobaculum bizertense]SKA75057.1 energy-coupling factor transport system permease protein [Desulfobaculum bizertense DSM 18034]
MNMSKLATFLRCAGGHPGRFTGAKGPCAKLPTGFKALLIMSISFTAFFTRTPLSAGALLLGLLALYIGAGLRPREIWQDFRIFFFQYPLILLLYAFRFGLTSQTATESLVVGLQITLVMLPAFWFQRTTPPEAMMKVLGRFLPGRLSFVVFTSLRFFPVLLREAKAIYTVQCMRGAKISPKQLMNPLHWPEFARACGIPLVVRALSIAEEAALAARARYAEKRH